MGKVIVIGGGASGLMCAYSSAKQNNQVILLEKNEKLGKKIYITGKGRCNLTNDVEALEFFDNVVSNPKFLYSSIFTFSPADTIKFFEEKGLSLTIERGKRVFPSSNKASDVTKTLEKSLIKLGVDVRLNTRVLDVLCENNQIKGVLTDKGEILCDSVVIATGGVSYPSTGSTGDGYAFANKLGHKIVSPKPSLVGVELFGNDFIEMQGLSLKNVSLSTFVNDRKYIPILGKCYLLILGFLVQSCCLLHVF